MSRRRTRVRSSISNVRKRSRLPVREDPDLEQPAEMDRDATRTQRVRCMRSGTVREDVSSSGDEIVGGGERVSRKRFRSARGTLAAK